MPDFDCGTSAAAARRLPNSLWHAEVILVARSAAREIDRRVVAVAGEEYETEGEALAVASLALQAFQALSITPFPWHVVPFVLAGEVGILHRGRSPFSRARGVATATWRLFWQGTHWLAFPLEFDGESPEGLARLVDRVRKAITGGRFAADGR